MSHARTVVHAKADGNCAFNAFVLGLCEPAVLDKVILPNADPFVVHAAQALSQEAPQLAHPPVTWDALKAYLKNADRDLLQERLAPILRTIAIATILQDPFESQQHLEFTTQAIQEELENYFRERVANEKDAISMAVVGDIFIRHPFIKNKFEELYIAHQVKGMDAAKAALVQWWNTPAGQFAFLARLGQPAQSAADVDCYAGDLELAPLGKHFSVNVIVESMRRHINVKIHNADRQIKPELAADYDALVKRGIINNERTWVDLSDAEATARLNAVPQLIDLVDHVVSMKPAINDVVPAEFNADCFTQLQARGVINSQNKFIIPPTQPDFMGRVTELASKDDVIADRKGFTPAVTITLQNESASHWNCVQSAPVAAAAKSPRGKGVTLPPVALGEGESEVGDAVLEAGKFLEKNCPPLQREKAVEKFDAVFGEFSALLKHFQAKKFDHGFFKTAQKQILDNFKQEVTAEVQKITKKSP